MGKIATSDASVRTSCVTFASFYVVRTITDHFYSDYATNELLDRYSDRDIDDQEDFDEMSAAQRRAAEASMARRDRLERGGRRGARAAARSRMPEFLQSDDIEDDGLDGGLLSGMKRRTRRQYDERRDIDDLDGVEDVSGLDVAQPQVLNVFAQELPLEQLSDIKAKSIAEWIANERVRRSIVRHFRQFLMTYVDEHCASVYGQRIRHLGESEPTSPLGTY